MCAWSWKRVCTISVGSVWQTAVSYNERSGSAGYAFDNGSQASLNTLAWGRDYTRLHSELRMRTLTATKWRRVSTACRWSKIWTAILVQLSVVSHNTQKGVVRRKLCRFSSKLSPEVLSFVSYVCLKFCVERRKIERRQNWRFSLRRFSPHGCSNVRLLVFLWTARQCKSICSLVVGFCRLFACIIPRSKTQLFKNSIAIPKYRVLPHSVILENKFSTKN